MNDVTSAPAVDHTPAPAPDTTPRGLSDMIAEARQAPESAEPATEPDEIPAQAENTAPAEEQPSGETTGEQPDPQTPEPIEPPRSWTKEAKERWQSLPRETQEYLSQREQERDRGLRQSQNEVAEQRKAIAAEREAAEKARKEYEAKLPALMQSLHDASPFADIRSMADVEKMQAEDPFRFQQFQVYQWKMQATQAELQQAEQRKTSETQAKWNNHVQEEGAKFAESLSKEDKAKIDKLMADAPAFMEERGFSNQELTDLWTGKERLSLHDHRIQSLILDGMKYRDLQKAPPKAAPKPVPAVQRPGTAKPPGSAQSETIQNLRETHKRTGNTKDLGALISALRRA